MKNSDLITSLLHINGTCGKLLPVDARRRIWAHANGYGDMNMAQLDALDLFEDWSHIRDSDGLGRDRVLRAIESELAHMDDQQRRALEAAGHDTSGLRLSSIETVREVVTKLGALNR